MSLWFNVVSHSVSTLLALAVMCTLRTIILLDFAGDAALAWTGSRYESKVHVSCVLLLWIDLSSGYVCYFEVLKRQILLFIIYKCCFKVKVIVL